MYFDTLTWAGLAFALVVICVVFILCKRQGCNKPIQ